MDCKNALTEARGDMDQAIVILRKKGLASAQKKALRVAAEGMIGQYIHAGGKLGVLVEVNCETDFAARSAEFQALVKDISMHIAAQNPLYVKREDVPAEARDAEARVYEQEAAEKPENVRERIVAGKLDAWYGTIVLLEQEMHNPKFEGKTVQQLRDELTAKTGENVVIRRFARFAIGQ